jgi:hypothetical protein
MHRIPRQGLICVGQVYRLVRIGADRVHLLTPVIGYEAITVVVMTEGDGRAGTVSFIQDAIEYVTRPFRVGPVVGAYAQRAFDLVWVVTVRVEPSRCFTAKALIPDENEAEVQRGVVRVRPHHSSEALLRSIPRLHGLGAAG